MKVRVLRTATEDAEDAHNWYEEERAALGERFQEELGNALRRIGSFPFAHPRVAGDVRRAILHRFPYGVFYSVEDEEAVVHRVLHLSRNPDLWKKS